jgi:DNA-binding response OmpR family regulator
LSSILTTMLRECPGLRVRAFPTAAALLDYARAAPVDLLVCDYALADARIADVATKLRSGALPERRVRVLALTGYVDRAVKIGVAAAGIDEIIIKPASPAHIRERAMVLLGERRAPARGSSSISLSPEGEPAPALSAKIIDLAAWRAEHPVNPHP